MRIACELMEMFSPYVYRIEVAGSLRRGSDANDIELVCVPRIADTQPGLFAGFSGATKLNHLDVYVADKMSCDVFRPRIGKDGKGAVGPKFKRLWYRHPRLTDAGPVGFDVALDLFSVPDPAHWGATFAIRTGPAGFSRLCVTSRADHGAMPMGMRQSDGILWRGKTPIETPEESDWFREIGLPHDPPWEPADRSEERLRAFLRGGS